MENRPKMEKNDELDEIFVDRNEPADKKVLVEILKPLVTIDSEGVISFSNEYNKLKESKKVLVYLLCKKAMCIRGIEGINEPSKESEVIEKVMVSKSTAKNALYTLYKTLVKREGEGYIIPNYNLIKTKKLLSEENKN